MSSRQFESLEELQEFANRFMKNKNRIPRLNFLGLSSDRMHRLLYSKLEDLEDIVRFNHELEPEAFQDIAIVKNTIYFLSRMRESQPLKATAKGNLPLAFAQELHNNFHDPPSRFNFSIRSEEESSRVNSLRHILMMCGWIKKAKKYFSLTKKGVKILDQGFSAAHFFTLLNIFTRKFNWAFQDSYPPFRIIQTGFLFSLYMLHLKTKKFTNGNDLGDYFIRAFPMVLHEAETIIYIDSEDFVRSCFSLRFLEYFCEYFGLANIKREAKTPYEYNLSIQRSSFFERYIDWSHIS